MASSYDEDSSSSNYHSFPSSRHTRSVSSTQPLASSRRPSTASDDQVRLTFPASRETYPAESLDQSWIKKHPPKTSVVVRIGGIINPAQFWVRELPISKNQRREAIGVHAEIFRFERGLASRYNVDPKANPDNQVPEPRPDILVAVRPSHISPHWYRGRIVSVTNAHEQATRVKVFLIDYGILLDEIQCNTCVRLLPRIMTFTKGLAKIVTLAGIRPLTLSVDFQLGMEVSESQEMAANWSVYSREFVSKILDQSDHKLALLTNWRLDAKKRIHGDLKLLGFQKRISLMKLLVDTGHGDYFPSMLKADLEANNPEKITGPRFTSIVAPGSVPGTRSLDPTLDFTVLSKEECEKYFVETPQLLDNDNEITPENDWMPMISQDKMEKARKRNRKKNDWYNRGDLSSAQSEVMTQSEPIGNPDWEDLRNEAEFVDSDEEEHERTIRSKRENLKQELEKRTMSLPAGIDTGKFLEEALDRMPEPNLGPKQILPVLLNDPNHEIESSMTEYMSEYVPE